jgi:F0F1-type ATP synthase delta subunit
MLDPQTATQALRSWCERRGVQTGVEEFLHYLQEKNALYLLPVVRKELRNAARDDARQNSLIAETGRELTQQQKQNLQSAFGAEAHDFQEHIDEQKIAGVDVTFASQQIRGSVASQLTQLQNELTS